MGMRVCAQPGCPILVEQGVRDGRCDQHRRAKDKARGTRQQRGYDAAHDALRAELLPQAYGQPCHLCKERMWPHEELALDHTEDRTGYRGIVHLSCNARDGAQRGNAARISPHA
jgi:hypothetical protein